MNDSHPDLRINFLEYWEFDKKGKRSIFSWVTNLPISADNAYELARAGRTRWKVENELFNVIKNKGYHLEHSYGHGKQFLCSTLGGLMLLAFLIDEIQELSCRLFQAARATYHARMALWERLRALFFTFDVQDWESLMRALADPGSLRMALHPGDKRMLTCTIGTLNKDPKQVSLINTRSIPTVQRNSSSCL